MTPRGESISGNRREREENDMGTVRMLVEIAFNLSMLLLFAVVVGPWIIWGYAWCRGWFRKDITLGECFDRIEGGE